MSWSVVRKARLPTKTLVIGAVLVAGADASSVAVDMSRKVVRGYFPEVHKKYPVAPSFLQSIQGNEANLPALCEFQEVIFPIILVSIQVHYSGVRKATGCSRKKKWTSPRSSSLWILSRHIGRN